MQLGRIGRHQSCFSNPTEKKLITRFQTNIDHNTSDLAQLMTAIPMTVEAHAAIMRMKVVARRANDDAIEASRQRRIELDDM
jgi:hypothetical protein